MGRSDPNPQDRGETGTSVRDGLGRFRPGFSGNKSGRPAGFAGQIQRLCGKDYKRIAEALFLIAMGTADARRKFFNEEVSVSTKDRIRALEALRDSGPGRPAQQIWLEEPVLVPAFALPPETPGVNVR
jgi:hypothetical protein